MEKILGPSAPTVAGFQTVAEAAAQLGMTPYDVMRLIKSGDVEGLVLVNTASLEAAKEKL